MARSDVPESRHDLGTDEHDRSHAQHRDEAEDQSVFPQPLARFVAERVRDHDRTYEMAVMMSSIRSCMTSAAAMHCAPTRPTATTNPECMADPSRCCCRRCSA